MSRSYAKTYKSMPLICVSYKKGSCELHMIGTPVSGTRNIVAYQTTLANTFSYKEQTSYLCSDQGILSSGLHCSMSPCARLHLSDHISKTLSNSWNISRRWWCYSTLANDQNFVSF